MCWFERYWTQLELSTEFESHSAVLNSFNNKRQHGAGLVNWMSSVHCTGAGTTQGAPLGAQSSHHQPALRSAQSSAQKPATLLRSSEYRHLCQYQLMVYMTLNEMVTCVWQDRSFISIFSAKMCQISNIK